MNDEEKKRLEHIKDDLVKLATKLATDENKPAEERISLLMAKIRQEADVETIEAAKKAIDEMDDSDLKLRMATDLIEEIEVANGNVRNTDDGTSDSNNQSDENPDPDQEHLVPDPHYDSQHDRHDQ